jgi:hypothetical protein
MFKLWGLHGVCHILGIGDLSVPTREVLASLEKERKCFAITNLDGQQPTLPLYIGRLTDIETTSAWKRFLYPAFLPIVSRFKRREGST